MISNFDSIEPLSKVRRWSSAAKVDVPQPKLFPTYNSYMEGVELHDQGVYNYRVSIQGKNGGGVYLLTCWMSGWLMLGS